MHSNYLIVLLRSHCRWVNCGGALHLPVVTIKIFSPNVQIGLRLDLRLWIGLGLGIWLGYASLTKSRLHDRTVWTTTARTTACMQVDSCAVVLFLLLLGTFPERGSRRRLHNNRPSHSVVATGVSSSVQYSERS